MLLERDPWLFPSCSLILMRVSICIIDYSLMLITIIFLYCIQSMLYIIVLYYTYYVRSNQDWSVPAIEQLRPSFLFRSLSFHAFPSRGGLCPWSFPAWDPTYNGGSPQYLSLPCPFMVDLYIICFSDCILWWWEYSVFHTICVTNACCVNWVRVSCSATCCFVFLTV